MSSESYLYYLEMARDMGVIIFNVDYAVEQENIEWTYETSRDYGFVPFVRERFLNSYVVPYP